VFGDGRALDDLKRIGGDRKEDPDTRRQAVTALVTARAEGLVELLRQLLDDRELGPTAVRGLGALDQAGTSDLLLARLPRLYPPAREAAIETLAARPESARKLLEAVTREQVAPHEVSPYLLRQMQLFGDASLQASIDRLWPQQKLIAADKLEFAARIRQQLATANDAPAKLERGQAIFKKACANCHKLFGEGEVIGPDLTGAQRNNLNYWLENLVDPSATVATDFRMSIVTLSDGRIITGVVGQNTEQTLAVQTPTEKVLLDRSLIDEIRATELSLMPDGLLAPLTAEEIRDLFAYMMQ
jgi:putative heme-binding domain-containing protein